MRMPASLLTSAILAMSSIATLAACSVAAPTSSSVTPSTEPREAVPSTAPAVGSRRSPSTGAATPTSTPPFDATVPPDRPSALDEPLSAEAAATVGEYVFLLMPYMWATGDTAEFEAFGTRECRYCASMLEATRDVFDLGQHEVGNQITIDSSSADLLDQEFLDHLGYPGPTASVTVNYVQGPWRRLDAAGKVVEKDAHYVYYNAHLHITRVNGAWKLRGVSVDQVLESKEPILGIRPAVPPAPTPSTSPGVPRG